MILDGLWDDEAIEEKAKGDEYFRESQYRAAGSFKCRGNQPFSSCLGLERDFFHGENGLERRSSSCFSSFFMVSKRFCGHFSKDFFGIEVKRAVKGAFSLRLGGEVLRPHPRAESGQLHHLDEPRGGEISLRRGEV